VRVTRFAVSILETLKIVIVNPKLSRKLTFEKCDQEGRFVGDEFEPRDKHEIKVCVCVCVVSLCVWRVCIKP